MCACVIFVGASGLNSQVEAYVRGAVSCGGSVDKVAIENSTAVFTKRVYRDAWNKNIVKRIADTRNHTLPPQ